MDTRECPKCGGESKKKAGGDWYCRVCHAVAMKRSRAREREKRLSVEAGGELLQSMRGVVNEPAERDVTELRKRLRREYDANFSRFMKQMGELEMAAAKARVEAKAVVAKAAAVEKVEKVEPVEPDQVDELIGMLLEGMP